MKIDWSNIIEGWRNQLIPPHKLKKLILKTAEERRLICDECEWNTKKIHQHKNRSFIDRCTDCGCPLIAKTKCLCCSCELEFPKWEAVLTEKQEEEFDYENTE